MTVSLARLRAAGVSVWLDDLSLERLTSGGLAALRGRGVSGVTTNRRSSPAPSPAATAMRTRSGT
jgi:hypothetical protein